MRRTLIMVSILLIITPIASIGFHSARSATSHRVIMSPPVTRLVSYRDLDASDWPNRIHVTFHNDSNFWQHISIDTHEGSATWSQSGAWHALGYIGPDADATYTISVDP